MINSIGYRNLIILAVKEFKDWCESKGIKVQFTQTGKPMQNGYIERFNGTFRKNKLDAYLFEDINSYRF